MIIYRQKSYSKEKESKLPESRIGVGWIQSKNGKLESEKYLKAGQKAADESYNNGDPEEKVIKKSGRAARNVAILDNSGKPLLKGAGVAGISYIAAKSPKIIESLARSRGVDLRIPENISRGASKHSGKIATAAGLITAGRYIPEIYSKQKAARVGTEINTKDRLRKANKTKSK